MEQVDEGVDPNMNVDSGGQVGQEDTQSFTARMDAISEMFGKIMSRMDNTDSKYDSIMMSLGPQGPQALEMGAIKEQMKQSEEKNEVRFKKLEESVYKNKNNKEVRFDETTNKAGASNKRPCEESESGDDANMGGASEAGSSKDEGVPGSFGGDSKSWGAKPKSASSAPNRLNRGDSGSSGAKGSGRAKAKDCRLWVKGFGRKLTKKTLEEQARMVISQINTGLG